LENIRDCNAKGRGNQGVRNGRATLTAEAVIEIRRLRKCEIFNNSKIGRMFGVHSRTIGAIVRRQAWKHI
jgi:hypothetical protein